MGTFGQVSAVIYVSSILKAIIKINHMKNLIRIAIVLLAIGYAGLIEGISQNVCGAMTSKNLPCKMRVKQLGAKCHHHADNGTANATVGKNGGSAVIHTCGAQTSKGLPCKRRVKIANAKCHSHE